MLKNCDNQFKFG